MRSLKILSLSCVCLSTFSSALSAVVIFQDDFTNDVANTGVFNTAGADYYPALQAGELGKRWMTRTPATSGTNNPIAARQYAVQVRNDDPIAPGNNHLTLFRNAVSSPSGPAFGYAHAQLTDSAVFSNTGGIVTTSLRILTNRAEQGTPALNGELLRVMAHPSNTLGNFNNNGDLSSASFVNGAFGVRFFNNTLATDTTRATAVLSGGLVTVGDPTPLPKYKFDEWNDLVVTANMGAAVPYFFFSLTNSDGTMTSANYKLQGATVTTIGDIQLTAFTDSLTRIDNLLVSNNATPEPTTLAALAIAAPLMRRRR